MDSSQSQGGGGGLKFILLKSNACSRFCCCWSTNNVKFTWRTPDYYNVSSQRNNTIILTHYDETEKMAHGSQIVRAKENLKFSHGGPSNTQASGTNPPIKALRQSHHWVWGLTHRRAIKEETDSYRPWLGLQTGMQTIATALNDTPSSSLSPLAEMAMGWVWHRVNPSLSVETAIKWLLYDTNLLYLSTERRQQSFCL